MTIQAAENSLRTILNEVGLYDLATWRRLWSAVMSLEEAVKAECAEDTK